MNTTVKKPVNYKLIFKITSAILFIMFFIPTMTVSCSGEDVNVSAGHAMVGYYSDFYGEVSTVSEPTIWPIFLLIFSIAMFVFACIKMQDVKTNAAIITVISVADIIGWVILKNAVKNFADENMCEFGISFGYILVMILLAVNIIITVALFANILPNNGSTVEATPAFCPMCGKQLTKGTLFCPGCGTKLKQ